MTTLENTVWQESNTILRKQVVVFKAEGLKLRPFAPEIFTQLGSEAEQFSAICHCMVPPLGFTKLFIVEGLNPAQLVWV